MKNCILLSWPRSGTNYFLAVYSELFPSDLVFDEIFRNSGDNLAKLSLTLNIDKTGILELLESDPKKLWEKTCQKASKSNARALVKVFYYHSQSAADLWDSFRDQNKIIHLVRRKAFDTFLSYKIAMQTGIWKKVSSSEINGRTKEKEYEIVPFQVSIEEIENFLIRRRQHMTRCRSFFSGSDFQEIYYEDISGSVGDCARVISDMFGTAIPDHPIEIGVRKQSERDPRELILNYSELARFDIVEE